MLKLLVELCYGLEDFKARARGALTVVVMCFGIAEIGHHAVAEVLRHTPAEAIDGLRRRAVILADNLTPFFGIQAAADLSRTDEVAEQYREMAPLAFGHCVRLAVLGAHRCGSRRSCRIRRLWQSSTAVTTELLAQFARCTTGRTRQLQRLAAFDAELSPRTVIVPAAGTAHRLSFQARQVDLHLSSNPRGDYPAASVHRSCFVVLASGHASGLARYAWAGCWSEGTLSRGCRAGEVAPRGGTE